MKNKNDERIMHQLWHLVCLYYGASREISYRVFYFGTEPLAKDFVDAIKIQYKTGYFFLYENMERAIELVEMHDPPRMKQGDWKARYEWLKTIIDTHYPLPKTSTDSTDEIVRFFNNLDNDPIPF